MHIGIIRPFTFVISSALTLHRIKLFSVLTLQHFLHIFVITYSYSWNVMATKFPENYTGAQKNSWPLGWEPRVTIVVLHCIAQTPGVIVTDACCFSLVLSRVRCSDIFVAVVLLCFRQFVTTCCSPCLVCVCVFSVRITFVCDLHFASVRLIAAELCDNVVRH